MEPQELETRLRIESSPDNLTANIRLSDNLAMRRSSIPEFHPSNSASNIPSAHESEESSTPSSSYPSLTYMTHAELQDVQTLVTNYIEKQQTLGSVLPEKKSFCQRLLSKFHKPKVPTDNAGEVLGKSAPSNNNKQTKSPTTSTNSKNQTKNKKLQRCHSDVSTCSGKSPIEQHMGDIVNLDKEDALAHSDSNAVSRSNLKHEAKSKSRGIRSLSILSLVNKQRPSDSEAGAKDAAHNGKDDDVADPNQQYGKSIFVRGTHMINPSHPSRHKWDMSCVLTALLYTAIRVPFTIAFDIDEFAPSELGWFIANRVVDVIFICDMLITFQTAIQDGTLLITDRKIVAIHYIKTWFLIDLLSSVPFDVILFFMQQGETNSQSDGSGVERSAKLLRVFKIVRILRLIKFQRIFLTLEMAMGVNFSIMSVVKFLFSIAMFAHLLACVLVAIDYQSSENWIITAVERQNLNDIDDSIGNTYIAALYWAISTISSVGYGDIAASTDGERWFSCLAMILGGVMFTYGLTHIVNLVADMNKNESKLFELLEHVEEWAAYYDFPEHLVKDIKQYFRYKADFVFAHENDLLESLTGSMKRKICEFGKGSIIRNLPMFHDCSESLISEILLIITTEFAVPHSLVMTQGSISTQMFIIRKGKCACYRGKLKDSPDTSVVALTNGQSFGEVSFLLRNVTRIVSVVALTWVDLFVIDKKDFQHLMKYYPGDLVLFERYVQKKYDTWVKIDTIQPMNGPNEIQVSNKKVEA